MASFSIDALATHSNSELVSWSVANWRTSMTTPPASSSSQCIALRWQ